MSKKRTTRKEKRKVSVKSGKPGYFMPVVLFCFLLLLTVLAYIRALKGPLIFDDAIYIRPSRMDDFWRYLSPHVRSVAELSFALNYAVSGLNIAILRATNVVFHILSSFAAFYLAYVTLTLPSVRSRYESLADGRNSFYIAFLAAAMFLLHPIQTSAVNYVTQRMAILAALFSFTGLILYVKGATTGGRASLAGFSLSALSFGLAIFSKENAVMVLPMVLIYDFVFISSFRWGEFRKRFIPLAALAAVLGLAVAYYLGAGGFFKKIATIFINYDQPMARYGWSGVDIRWTPAEYLLTELRVVSRYILLVFAPAPSLMVFDYSSAYPVSKGLFNPATTFLSLVALVSAIAFSLRYIKRAPLVCFGIIWYLVTISLESFIAIGLDPYFEHRNYLPVYGLFLMVASLLVYVDRLPFKIRKEAIIFCVALLLFFPTYVRNGIWARGDLLWKDAVEKVPDNPRALISMSSIFIKERRFREAEEYLERVGRLQPLSDKFRGDMFFNLASVYRETNRKDLALATLKNLESETSLSKDMRSYVQFFIGDILREEQNFAGAKEYLEKAYSNKKTRRNNPGLLVSLGALSRSLGDTGKAERYFEEAIKADPAGSIPYVELGDIYLAKNDIEKAEKNYSEAAVHAGRLDMARRALYGLAQIAMLRDEFGKAEGLLGQVVNIAPGYYGSYVLLGGIRIERNDPDGAMAYLGKALSLKESFVKDKPETKLLHLYLGEVYLAKGDRKTARKNFDMFLSLAEGDRRLQKYIDDARKGLAKTRD